MQAPRFYPLRIAAPDALAQCKKCGAVQSIDMVDIISGVRFVHKSPDDPRYASNPCGGLMKLYQEVRYVS